MVTLDAQTLDKIVDELSDRYAGSFTREEVSEVVRASHDELAPTSRSPQYLPVFVRKFALDRLVHLAEERGFDRHGVQDVLFICNGNAGRSQMAAALANEIAEELAPGRVRAWSAGVNPMAEVLPEVREVMSERGMDIGEAFPKPITSDATKASEYIVAIGVSEGELPVHGRHTLHWDIPPVIGQGVPETRAARDDLERRVRELLTEITA